MNEPESVLEVEPTEPAPIAGSAPMSIARVGLGLICGLALIVSIIPTCSCSGRTRRSEVGQRQAAIEEAIRQQTVHPPAPGHERTATAEE